MKRLNCVMLIIVIILLVMCPFHAYSATSEEILTSHIDENEIADDYSVTLLKTEPEKYSIVCFDVSDNNDIALVTENSSNYYVSVYDSDFDFRYSFSLSSASSINVEWQKDDIVFYYHRGNVAVSYNNLGEITDISRFEDTTENSINFTNMDKPLRLVGNNEYKLKNNMGILNRIIGQSSYSQLMKVDEQGQENLLYSVNSKQFAATITFSLFFVCLVIIVVIAIAKSRKKQT